MDALRSEGGQALIVAVLFLAIAAVVIGGLRFSQERIFAISLQHRAGEAAAEAATVVVADAYVAELRRVAASTRSPAPTPDVLGAVTKPDLLESARAAASDLSVRNGGSDVSDVSVRCERGQVDVALVLAGRRYRAGFAAAQCSPR